MSVWENMAFGLTIAGASKEEKEQKVAEAARILQMEHLLDRRPSQLSGGQRLSIRVIFFQQMASSIGTPETCSDFLPQNLLRESFTRNQAAHLKISIPRRDANQDCSDRWLWRGW